MVDIQALIDYLKEKDENDLWEREKEREKGDKERSELQMEMLELLKNMNMERKMGDRMNEERKCDNEEIRRIVTSQKLYDFLLKFIYENRINPLVFLINSKIT